MMYDTLQISHFAPFEVRQKTCFPTAQLLVYSKYAYTFREPLRMPSPNESKKTLRFKFEHSATPL